MPFSLLLLVHDPLKTPLQRVLSNTALQLVCWELQSDPLHYLWLRQYIHIQHVSTQGSSDYLAAGLLLPTAPPVVKTGHTRPACDHSNTFCPVIASK